MSDYIDTNQNLHPLIREITGRAVVAVGLASIGVIHLVDAIGKYHETRYLFWMYIALIVGCIVVAGAVLFTRIAGGAARPRPGSRQRGRGLRAEPHNRAAPGDR